jgi:hypothetical protein
LAREISTSAATLAANPSLPGSTPMSAITPRRLSSSSPQKFTTLVTAGEVVSIERRHPGSSPSRRMASPKSLRRRGE